MKIKLHDITEHKMLVVGIDVGGTNTKLGAVTCKGKIFHKHKFRTKDYPEKEAFLHGLKDHINILLATIEALEGTVELAGIGIGAPKANYYTGVAVGAANLAWKGVVDFRGFLEEQFEVPVVVTNDANLAAIGEKEFGAARQMRNFLSVTIGTGLGCGIYTSGFLVHGQSDVAGELGHTSAKINGRYCQCGKRGCLETYVSAKGLVRTTLKLLSKYEEESALRAVTPDHLTPDMISEAAMAGDKVAHEVLEYTGHILGYKLSDVVAMYNPEAIFLTGGIANAGKLLFEPARRNLIKYIYNTYPDPVRLLPSALKDDEISVLGAGALIWEHLKNKMTIAN